METNYGNTSGGQHYSTLPLRVNLNDTRNHVSFTSISSSESGNDASNKNHDEVDAIPLKVKRMPLFEGDYRKQRQASVENLLSSRTSSNRSSEETSDETTNFNPELEKLLPARQDRTFPTSGIDPCPYTEIKKSDQVHSSNGHAKVQSAPLDLNKGIHNKLSHGKQFNNNSSKYSNSPHHHESTNQPIEGTDETEDRTDEIDLGVVRRPRPSFQKDPQIENSEQLIEKVSPIRNEDRSVPVTTPPKNIHRRSSEEEQEPNGCCNSTPSKTCCALFKKKYLLQRFSIPDICLTLFSMGVFIFDLVTDLLLTLIYYRKIDEHEEYTFFFVLTLCVIVIPSVIVQLFSFTWVIQDYRAKKRSEHKTDTTKGQTTAKDACKLFMHFVTHMLQVAVLVRYIRALIYGFKSRYYEVKKKENHRDHFDKLYKYEVQDISLLRLLESFLESAPQLVLQIYIMLMTKQRPLITVISCCASLLALSSVMVTIQRAIRNTNPDKKQLSIQACIVMFLWRVFTISSRVLAFALFLTIWPIVFFVFIGIHWILATIWIAWKGTKFCPKKALEILFDGIVGLIYVFCFFNVHEEKEGKTTRSRYRMLIFYLVVLAENSVLSILWFYFRPGGSTDLNFSDFMEGILQRERSFTTPPPIPTENVGVFPPAYALGLLLAVHGFFLIGIAFMLVYYASLHPKRNGSCCGPSKSSGHDPACQVVSAPAELAELPPSQDVPPATRTSANKLLTSEQLPDTQPETSNTVRAQQVPQGVHLQRNYRDYNADTLSQLPWSDTMFRRQARAEKVYSRQYSREKLLDIGESERLRGENTRRSPRETDRFGAIVTPLREKKPVLESSVPANSHNEKTLSESTKSTRYARPITPSVVIKPGSGEPSKLHMAPRSVTHQTFQSYTLASPVRKSPRYMDKSLTISPDCQLPQKRRRHVPGPAESRGYSASMSCLVDEKPKSHAARRLHAMNPDVYRAPSFTIGKNEVVECMESSV